MHPSVFTKENGNDGSLGGTQRRESHLGLLISPGKEWALGQEFNCTDLFGSFVFVAADAGFFLFVCSFVCFVHL